MSSKTQRSKFRGTAVWGSVGAATFLIGGFGMLLANEQMADWSTDFFLGLGFNPREEAIICIVITAAVASGLGFLFGWGLRLLWLGNSNR